MGGSAEFTRSFQKVKDMRYNLVLNEGVGNRK